MSARGRHAGVYCRSVRAIGRGCSPGCARRTEAGTSIFEVTRLKGREWVREEGLRTNGASRHYETRPFVGFAGGGLRRLDKVRLPSGEQLVLILTDVRPGRYDALSDEQKTSLRAQLAQRSQGVDFTAFRGARAGFYHQAGRSNITELP